MLAWLPIVGPILQGLFNTASTIYSKMKDTQLGMRQAEVTEAQVSAQIIQSTSDDIGLRLARDIICFPVAVWCALGTWDTIVAKHYPSLMFVVEKFPDSMAMIPYAVLTFLLGNIGINTWLRNK